MELTQEAELLQNFWKTYLGSSVEKLAFFVFALGIIAATKFCWEKLKRKNLPPGPWGLPVIGKQNENVKFVLKSSTNSQLNACKEFDENVTPHIGAVEAYRLTLWKKAKMLDPGQNLPELPERF